MIGAEKKTNDSIDSTGKEYEGVELNFNETNFDSMEKSGSNFAVESISESLFDIQEELNSDSSQFNESFSIEWSTPIVDKNYSSRVLKITETIVSIEVLIDSNSLEFEERVFDKILFDHLPDLEEGDYILIRSFQRPGRAWLEINDGDKFVNKKIFEDYSEFDYLDEIKTPSKDLGSID